MTVVAEETAEATVTNTYAQQLGSLTITKDIEGGDYEAARKTYTFIVTGPNGYRRTETITGEGSVTLTELVPGEYRVSERDASIDGHSWRVSGEGSVTV